MLAESLRGEAKVHWNLLFERFSVHDLLYRKRQVDHLSEHYFPWCLPIGLPSLLAGVKVTFVFPPVVNLIWNKSDKYQLHIGSKGIQTQFPPEQSGTRMTPGEDCAKSRNKRRRLRDICSLQCSTGRCPALRGNAYLRIWNKEVLRNRKCSGRVEMLYQCRTTSDEWAGFSFVHMRAPARARGRSWGYPRL